jgi:hypothetical protein
MYLICVKPPLDTFPFQNGLKQGDTLTPLLNMPLGSFIISVGLEFNGTHHFLICLDDDKLLTEELC